MVLNASFATHCCAVIQAELWANIILESHLNLKSFHILLLMERDWGKFWKCASCVFRLSGLKHSTAHAAESSSSSSFTLKKQASLWHYLLLILFFLTARLVSRWEKVWPRSGVGTAETSPSVQTRYYDARAIKHTMTSMLMNHHKRGLVQEAFWWA